MSHRSDIRAGVFVVCALAILAVGTLWIAGLSGTGDGPSYEVALAGSSGIRRGDRVRVAGIEAGRVRSVELRAGEEWPVRFEISLEAGIALTEGTTARITSDGLLGSPYLEIVPGPSGAATLAPGSLIPGGEGGSVTQTLEGLSRTTDRLPLLLDSANALLASLNREIEPLLAGMRQLVSEDSVENFSGALASLSRTLDDVGPRLTDLLARLDGLAGQLEKGVGGLPEVTDDVHGLVADLRSALGPDGQRLAELFGTAESTLGSAEGALSTLEGNRADLDATLRDLREAVANLRSLSQTLKERPSLLLRSPKAPDRKPGEKDGS